MYSKKSSYRYGNSNIQIKDVKQIYSQHIVQEHPMILTERKGIRREVQEQQRQEGYATDNGRD